MNTESQSQTYLLKQMLQRVKPHGRTFALCLFLLLLTSLAKMLSPVVLQIAIDDYIIPGDFPGLLKLLLAYVALLLLGFLANYYEIIRLELVGQTIIAEIKMQAFQHLLRLDLQFFDRSTTGKLVSRIENDANAMKVLFTTVITNILGNFLVVLGMFGVMAYKYDFRLALYIVGLCPLMLGAALYFNHLMAPRLIHLRKLVADVNSWLTEIIHGMSTIQIFGQQARMLKTLEERSLEKYRVERFNSILFNSFFNLMFFVQTLGLVLVLWLGGKMVMAGSLTIGSLILFMTFIRQFFVPIMFLSAQFNEFQKGSAAAARIFELLNEPMQPEVAETGRELNSQQARITFENVWFRYHESGEWVLQDLSFDCPAGQHWAVIGPTGSGKTTLIHLLLKFYQPQKGRILIDGQDIRDLSHQALRQKIGLVLQDTVLFPGTIRENLLLGQEIVPEVFQAAMTEIGLDAIIQRFPQGYETEIQENAQNLSSGEKQLLSFGRALLRAPALLILDEATSHIDPETERKIQGAMQSLLAGRTALIIAHRLATIEHADKILVLKYGQLLEMGSHQELLAHQGVYAELLTLQTAA